MAYTNFTNCTEQQYKEIIYSQGDTSRIRIWFNNIELLDADEYCESFSGTNRMLPNDGSKRFSLDNFVAKEYDLILRDLPSEVIIQDQVKISIGTLVDSENDIYEDVPIGIFNIQDTPTTDNNKTTIKLRDNRVKFDFNYNAEPLIERLGGSATKGQILNDICSQANVVNNVGNFNGENDEVAIYDNTIKGTTYVAYLLEQSGYIPTIDRYGELLKIDLSNLSVYKIPLDLIEKYELGTPYKIDRVIYESGTIKYETSSDETLDTLYLNASNPYITTQEQVDYIYNKLKSFQIDSVTTGRILGNPAIDSYDLIQVYGYYEKDEYGNEVFVDDDSVIVFTTLANNTFTYNGVNRHTFDTQIGKEARTENVSKNSEQTFRRWARSEIDNANVRIINSVGEINDLEGRVNTAEQILDSQGAKLDIVSTHIDPVTGDVLELKRTNYEIGRNGIITTGEDGYKAIRNTTGDYFYDNEVMTGKYTKDGSVQKDLALFGKYYYGINGDLDVENFSKEDAMFVTELVEDEDGEECVAHFSNLI